MTAALTPILPDAHATTRRILDHLRSDGPKTYGGDVDEPADTEPDWSHGDDVADYRAADEAFGGAA